MVAIFECDSPAPITNYNSTSVGVKFKVNGIRTTDEDDPYAVIFHAPY